MENFETAKLNQLYKNACEVVTVFNDTVEKDKHRDILAMQEKARKSVEDFNTEQLKVIFSKLLAEKHPFRTAVERCYYPFLKVSFPIEKETKIQSAELEMTDEVINLPELEKASKKRPLAYDPSWIFRIEAFTRNMAARATEDIGGDMKKFHDCYKICEKAKGCDVGATPTSNTQMLKQLQIIIDGILFEDNGKGENVYKAIKKDVMYILYTMCKRSGKNRLTVSMPRPTTMCKLVTEVLHRIVTNSGYTADYEMIK